MEAKKFSDVIFIVRGLLLWICVFFFVNTNVLANNIRINGKPRVVNIVGDTAFVELNLSWDNSWRDDFNWDAAWIFLKYKKRGVDEPWHHGYLTREGHDATPQSGDEGGEYSFMFGQTGSGSNAKITGVFLMRDVVSDGNVSVRVRLKWLIKANTKKTLTAASFGDKLDEIYISVHAIEMVYIPYESYYLGDNYSGYSFAKSGVSPCLIDSEDAVTLTTVNPSSTSVTLPAAFPKGYVGFYIMKYETSQEQYMEFLNTLTLTQQKAHVTNNNFSTMKRGDYVFGTTNSPTRRNGIVFIEQKGEGGSAVFGNNLSLTNDLFARDDGQTLACGHLSPYDMLAYCDWSGLRPISELEYEKACRRPYPQIPDKGEYAWNSNSSVNPLTGVSDLLYPGDEREQSVNKNHNINAGNLIEGPVRSGAFATASTNQPQSGATFWGVMEMSGNLGEICYVATSSGKGFVANNVTYSHGDGELNADGSTNISSSYWPNTAAAFGMRGGSYYNPDSLACTSYRGSCQGTTFSSIDQRFYNFGFRGARTLLNTTGFDGGAILCPNGLSSDTVCADVNVKLQGVLPNNSVGKLSYSWYFSTNGGTSWTLITGETGENLEYTFANTTTTYKRYKIKRKVTCAVGQAEAQADLYVAPKPWTHSLETVTNKPPLFTSFTVESTWGNMPQTHWKLETPPTGISISNHGVVSGLTANSVFWTNVTVSSDKCPGIEYTKKLVIQREFTSGSSSITLAPGEYVMECYGAEGGQGKTNGKLKHYGGNGAYTKGTILLSSSQLFYAYVGGKGYNSGANGKCVGASGGWNGGGNGGKDGNCDSAAEPGAGGGGASDIRLEGGAWNSTTSLRSRIMVAGGGGGGVYGSDGGTGGTLSAVGGANQISGNAFGEGGAGTNNKKFTAGPGGGGGGYYGGPPATSSGEVGHGGSSFISGYSGCNAVNISGSHTGQSIHYSGLQFYNATMSSGARSGEGLVRISPALP
ncbi:glycine-rich protein [Odoribacter lunatus]|uniref:glycine-rich protein n=1 Tax=Odoribacter lunatus TaxID=2941335 RepID=UPI00203CB1B9|nr:glycine-rich protein [Odoribacter lunatus]